MKLKFPKRTVCFWIQATFRRGQQRLCRRGSFVVEIATDQLCGIINRSRCLVDIGVR